MQASPKHTTTPPNAIPILKPLEEKGLDLCAAVAIPPVWPGDFTRTMVPRTEWYYSLALGGYCHMLLPGKTLPLKRGDMLITSPTCMRGFIGHKRMRFYRIFWAWRSPPLIPFIKPEEGKHLLIKMSESKIRQLQRLHATCRKLLRHIDQFTQFKLLNARLEIELILAQKYVAPDSTETPALQFALALRWMEEHVTKPDIIGALCQYLAISPATLNRLFHRRLKISPETYFQKLKMKRAQAWLQSGNFSIKAIAYHLGYKHPGNFTRAYKRQVGVAPAEHISHRSGQDHAQTGGASSFQN